MTTNKEWLFSLPLDEQIAWMNQEHVEGENGILDGDTAAENADSRELILTDLEKKTREWHDYDGNYMRIYSDVAYAQMKELLDRQAAITEEKTRYKWVTASAEEIAAWRSKAEKMKEQVYELTAERDNLADDLLIANKQREWYRKKFGKCLDYADAIHALMDEGMA